MSSILGSSDARRNETSSSAQTLLEFFNKKVEAVRRATGGSPAKSYLDPLAASSASLEQCTPSAVEEIIQSAASKFYSLDPIPTTILKEFLPEILSFVTRMCNVSLQDGILPLSQKHAIVTRRLKKISDQMLRILKIIGLYQTCLSCRKLSKG